MNNDTFDKYKHKNKSQILFEISEQLTTSSFYKIDLIAILSQIKSKKK